MSSDFNKMHRSNNSSNESNHSHNQRQSSSLSSASSTTSSTSSSAASTGGGRRGYNRSHPHPHHPHHHNNNFKFHNFVFNETNQKFCLEEQHGNKKITVTHWKKSDDHQQPDPASKAAIRQCDSDSKLIKSERFTIDRLVNDDLDRGKCSKEAGGSGGGGGGGVTSSASFPLSSSSFNRQPTFDLSKFGPSLAKHDHQPELSPPPLPPQPQPKPPSTRLSHLNSENSLFSSSGHSSASFLSPLESSSSSTNYGRFDSKHSDNDSISKSYFSGSSIASSSCSAINSSLDNLKLNENRYRTSAGSGGDRFGSWTSINNRGPVLEEDDDDDDDDSGDESDHSDLDVEDFFYRTYRRKLQQRIETLENLIEETIQSQPLDLSIKRDYNNNNKDDDDDGGGGGSGGNHGKAMHDDDAPKLDEDAKSGCESVDSLMSTRLDSPPPPPPPLPPLTTTTTKNRFKSYFDASGSSGSGGGGGGGGGSSSSWFRSHLEDQQHQRPQPFNLYPDFSQTMRQESLSPSELIASMKCCSPLSDDATTISNSSRLSENEKSTSTTTTTTATTAASSSSSSFSLSNPFMFPHERTKMFESFEPIISDHHHHHHDHDHDHQQQQQQRHFSPNTVTPTTAAEMFDALVEEEIRKFLQNSASTSSSSSASSCSSSFMDPFRNSPHHRFQHQHQYHQQQQQQQQHQHHPSDLSKRIEEKLKLLQQEVLTNKLSESNFGNFLSDHHHHHHHQQHGCFGPDHGSGSPNPDSNLRMHFKFDSNQNLEPYLMDSGFRTHRPGWRPSMEPNQIWNPIMSAAGTSGLGGGGGSSSSGGPGYLARNRLNHRNQIKRHLEDSFKQNGFLVKTKQVSDANNSAMFCKFRQLRKYTRYYLKSWQNHLPDEVNKLWKGFLPPKSDRPLFLTSSTTNILPSNDDDFVAASLAATATATTAASTSSEASNYPPSSFSSLSVGAPSPPSNSSSTSSQFTPSME